MTQTLGALVHICVYACVSMPQCTRVHIPTLSGIVFKCLCQKLQLLQKYDMDMVRQRERKSKGIFNPAQTLFFVLPMPHSTPTKVLQFENSN